VCLVGYLKRNITERQLSFIRNFAGFVLSPDVGCPDYKYFRGLPQSQKTCWEILYVTSRPLPSASFTVHYSVILPFDAVKPELLRASLNEPLISRIYYKINNF